MGPADAAIAVRCCGNSPGQRAAGDDRSRFARLPLAADFTRLDSIFPGAGQKQLIVGYGGMNDHDSAVDGRGGSADARSDPGGWTPPQRMNP